MNVAGRLIIATCLVVVCTLMVVVWGAERSMRSSLEHNLSTELGLEAHAVLDLLSPARTGWHDLVVRASRRSGHRIAVRDSVGHNLASSDSLAGDNVLRVEVVGGPGSILVSGSLTGVDRAVKVARGSMIRAALLALLVSIGLAWLAGRRVAAPIVQLTAAARAISVGQTPYIPRSGLREIDALGQALREMNRQLGDRFEELRREKADSTAIVAAMGDGILAANSRAEIVIANDAARRLLGYNATERLPDLNTLFRTKAARELVADLVDRGVTADREISQDGRNLTLHARPLAGGGALLVLRDLTEVRRLEAVRRDFVANVSHELKTPLTSISGYAETLATGGVDDASAARFIATIRSNAHRMQTLIDDLLDLSRIESGGWAPRPVPVDLTPAVTEAWQAGADRAADGEISFSAQIEDDAHHLTVDPGGLRQVLGNLLDNALRYAGRGGRVTVSSRRREGGIEIAVSDTGSGIPAEHLPRIFERFYRVDPSRSREAGGTGLGLAIVRHIVESHGGRVVAESVLRRGTTIRCWFPSAGGDA